MDEAKITGYGGGGTAAVQLAPNTAHSRDEPLLRRDGETVLSSEAGPVSV